MICTRMGAVGWREVNGLRICLRIFRTAWCVRWRREESRLFICVSIIWMKLIILYWGGEDWRSLWSRVGSWGRLVLGPQFCHWLLLDKPARSLSCGTKEASLTSLPRTLWAHLATHSVRALSCSVFLSWLGASWEQELCHLSLYPQHRAKHIVGTQWMLNEWSVILCNWSLLPKSRSRGRRRSDPCSQWV